MIYLLSDEKGQDIDFIKSDIQEKIKISGGLYGELEPEDRLDISLSNVSHIITNIKFDNTKIYGEVKFVSNPRGDYAKYYLENFDYQFKARKFYIGNRFKIITWDIINYAPLRKQLRDERINSIID